MFPTYMTFFDIFCLFCDILTYSLSEGAECLESHLQVIRNPWTNFVKNVRQMWKSAPCWWFCENFWFTASWKDCFGSPGGLDIKSLNCIQWNFRKLENIAPCCEHFYYHPFGRAKNFWEFRCWEIKILGLCFVQTQTIISDEKFCEMLSFYWKVLKSLERFRTVLKSFKVLKSFEKFWKVLESFAKWCHFVRASVVSVS